MSELNFSKDIEGNHEKPKKTEFICNCTLSFEKRTLGLFSDFGQKVCFIIPPHGDLRCLCKPCTINRYVNNEEKSGWRLIEVIDHDKMDAKDDGKKEDVKVGRCTMVYSSNCFS